jgi:hypothetical protein
MVTQSKSEIMKSVLFFSFLMFTSVIFAQKIKIDSTSFIKPGVPEVILDSAITKNLEPFRDKDDAIIYLYRLKSIVGSIGKFPLSVDKFVTKIGQNEYVVAHINTIVKGHHIITSYLNVNYVNFQPHKYYMLRQRGVSYIADYLDVQAINELKSCKRIDALKK